MRNTTGLLRVKECLGLQAQRCSNSDDHRIKLQDRIRWHRNKLHDIKRGTTNPSRHSLHATNHRNSVWWPGTPWNFPTNPAWESLQPTTVPGLRRCHNALALPPDHLSEAFLVQLFMVTVKDMPGRAFYATPCRNCAQSISKLFNIPWQHLCAAYGEGGNGFWSSLAMWRGPAGLHCRSSKDNSGFHYAGHNIIAQLAHTVAPMLSGFNSRPQLLRWFHADRQQKHLPRVQAILAGISRGGSCKSIQRRAPHVSELHTWVQASFAAAFTVCAELWRIRQVQWNQLNISRGLCTDCLLSQVFEIHLASLQECLQGGHSVAPLSLSTRATFDLSFHLPSQVASTTR